MSKWLENKENLGKEITNMLYDAGMIKTWWRDRPEGWTLHSGLWSPIYINLRSIGSFPDILKKAGDALGKLIKNESPETKRIVGIATAGVPIAAAISVESGIPSGYTRKVEGVKTAEEFREKITSYGQHTMVEGIFHDNDKVILVDDLVTRLTSKLVAIEQFRAEMERRQVESTCDTLLVLLDREQGADELAKKNHLKLLSLIPFKSKGIHWLKDRFSEVEYETISEYLKNSDKFQNKEIQHELKNTVSARK